MYLTTPLRGYSCSSVSATISVFETESRHRRPPTAPVNCAARLCARASAYVYRATNSFAREFCEQRCEAAVRSSGVARACRACLASQESELASLLEARAVLVAQQQMVLRGDFEGAAQSRARIEANTRARGRAGKEGALSLVESRAADIAERRESRRSRSGPVGAAVCQFVAAQPRSANLSVEAWT
eukprot:2808357-Pleurochrysis_carterae.AAC.2